MTDTDTKALRDLLAKATPGEWRQLIGLTAGRVVFSVDATVAITGACNTPQTAALIVALHNAAPALLDELDYLREEVAVQLGNVKHNYALAKRLQAENERLRAALTHWQEFDRAELHWPYMSNFRQESQQHVFMARELARAALEGSK